MMFVTMANGMHFWESMSETSAAARYLLDQARRAFDAGSRLAVDAGLIATRPRLLTISSSLRSTASRPHSRSSSTSRPTRPRRFKALVLGSPMRPPRHATASTTPSAPPSTSSRARSSSTGWIDPESTSNRTWGRPAGSLLSWGARTPSGRRQPKAVGIHSAGKFGQTLSASGARREPTLKGERDEETDWRHGARGAGHHRRCPCTLRLYRGRSRVVRCSAFTGAAAVGGAGLAAAGAGFSVVFALILVIWLAVLGVVEIVFGVGALGLKPWAWSSA